MKTKSCSMQSNENKVEIEFEGLNFQGFLGELIATEFKNCLKEFDSQLSNAPCRILLKLTNDLLMTWNEIRDMKGRLTHERMYQFFKNAISKKDTEPIMQTEFSGHRDKKKNVLIVDELTILINTDQLADFITMHIDDLEYVLNDLKLGVRHEIGHVIDFIRYHNMDFDEYREERDRRISARNEYYSSKNKRDEIENLVRYYSLEEEKAANDAVGISIDDKIKYNKLLIQNNHTESKTTITLNSKHEPIKEEDNDDGERE